MSECKVKVLMLDFKFEFDRFLFA